MATVKKVETLPKLEKMLRVAAYARVSSGKDAMLHSLFNQVSYYSDLIQSTEGWEFAGVYVDEAKTGTKDRPEFNRLIQDALDGKIDMIITKSMSRFARNTLTMLDITRKLKAVGVDIYFQSENLHSTSLESEMILTIIASIAQEEARQVSENQKWRIRKEFQEGHAWSNKNCYGYRAIDNKLVVVPEEAEIVKMIYQWCIEGCGSITIAKELNKMGVKTLQGCRWNYNHVLAVLSNIVYTGDIILQCTYRENYLTKRTKRNRGQCPRYYVEKDHEPIISMETFLTAADCRKERLAVYKAPTGCKMNYPLAGMMICGKCGAAYKHKVVRGVPLWICSTYNSLGKDDCFSKRIPEAALYEALNAEFGYQEFDEADFKKRVERVIVCDENVLTLKFKDGSEKNVVWKDHSRRDSWTPEMREQARQHAMKRYTKGVE